MEFNLYTHLYTSFLLLFLVGCAQKPSNPSHSKEKKVIPKKVVNNTYLEQYSENYIKKHAVFIDTEQNASSWEDFGINGPEKHIFLMQSGDYRSLGVLKLTHSGTADKKRIICYYNPQSKSPYRLQHPATLSQKEEVLLEGFSLNASSHWILFGLTFRGIGHTNKQGNIGGSTSFIENEANYNILDYCVIEKVLAGNAIRIRTASYNTIQNCVIRDKVHYIPSSDNIGITISAYKDREAVGNRILYNEIYNYTDGIQLTYLKRKKNDTKPHQKSGEIKSTHIEGNDIYITTDLYVEENGQVFACAENGIDIKGGTSSTLLKDRNYIVNNSLWGFRETKKNCGGSGSGGDAMIFHVGASNFLVEGNYVFNSSGGIVVKSFLADRSNRKIGNINIKNNMIVGIKKYSHKTTGTAFLIGSDVEIENNTVLNSDVFLKKVANPRIEFKNNEMDEQVNLSEQNLSFKKSEIKIKQIESRANEKRWIKQWTNPQKILMTVGNVE